MPAVMLAVFALTLFISAVLMFLIEFMVGKMMLPLMGGTPAVWNTCMVFYQAVLLAGYAYSHFSIRWLNVKPQSRLHLAVILAPILSFMFNAAIASGPLAPNEELVTGREGNPIPTLLLVLTLSIGLPMFVISTTAPALQRWFSATDHPSARDPYFLYGASNLGSMLAMLGYPFIMEPYASLISQQYMWVTGFGLLAAGVLACAVLTWSFKGGQEQKASTVPDSVYDIAGFLLFVVGVGMNLYFFIRTPFTDNFVNVSLGLLGGVLWWLGFCMFRGRFLRGLSPAADRLAEWVSVPLPEQPAQESSTPTRPQPQPTGIKPSASPVQKAGTYQSAAPPTTLPEPEPIPAANKPVTWGRRLYWVALAAVPSSLMLGVTTYITTDIAAIPLLWMPPLLLYLLTFIIVFAVIPTRVQNITVFVGVVLLALLAMIFGVPAFFKSDAIRFIFGVMFLGCIGLGVMVLRLVDKQLIHRTMIILMPLLLLLLLFCMMSEFWPFSGTPGKILLVLFHCSVMFIVTMVCHGELAADRPEPKYLTEFFLLMSVGGVVGGLFNALVAPVVFSSLVEYQLGMVIACLLLPAMTGGAEGPWARWVDVALGGVILAIGLVLLMVRFVKELPSYPVGEGEEAIPMMSRTWVATLLLIGPVLWLGLASYISWIKSRSWQDVLLFVGSFVPFLFTFAYILAPQSRREFFLLVLTGPVLWTAACAWLVYKDRKNWGPILTQTLVLLPFFVSFSLLLLGSRSTLAWNIDSQGKLEGIGGIDLDPLIAQGTWKWLVTALGLAFLGWLALFVHRMRQPINPDGHTVLDYRLSVLLDFVLPATLFVLVLGLYWGLPADTIAKRLGVIAQYMRNKGIEVKTSMLTSLLTYGLPAVLCYTFVERWARFGLGVGALVLAAGYSGMLSESPLHQDRSFFGVLKVEDRRIRYPEDEYDDNKLDPYFPYWPVRRLVHGTTLHGKQFRIAAVRDTPLSYYHRTGPVGLVFREFNDNPSKPFAVIGLGTGTMASYGLKGQRLDFFDIDPVVVDIAYDTNRYFHFVEDAENRGVDVGLILGDARLTFDPRDWRERKELQGKTAAELPSEIRSKRDQKRLKPLRKREWHGKSVATWFAEMDDDKDGKLTYFEWMGSDADWEKLTGSASRDSAVNTMSLEQAKGFKPPPRPESEPLTSDVKYRLIVVDAFSSDAIPVHLITDTALQIYLDRLDEGGVLLIHISNRYLDLQPVLANHAVKLGIHGLHMSDDDNKKPGKNRSHWVALAREQKTLDRLTAPNRWETDEGQLALLGAAIFPRQIVHPTSAMMPDPIAGMSLALWHVAREQSVEQYYQERNITGKDREQHRAAADRSVSLYEPLETTPYLESLEKTNKPLIDAAAKRAAELKQELAKFERDLKDVEEPLGKLQTELTKTNEQLSSLSFQLKDLPRDEQLKVNQQIAKLEATKKKLEPEIAEKRKKADELELKRQWIKELHDNVEVRRRLLERANQSAKKKIAKNERTGIWTDDYANLLAVFSW